MKTEIENEIKTAMDAIARAEYLAKENLPGTMPVARFLSKMAAALTLMESALEELEATGND